MRTVKKIRIRLNASQLEIANRTLRTLHSLWNEYIEASRESLSAGGWDIERFRFDKDHFPEIATDHPEYLAISSMARQDMFRVCSAAQKHAIKRSGKRPEALRFRSWRHQPIHSYFFCKYGVRLIDESHVWIPILHIIKLREKNYLLTSDIQYITGGRIVYDAPRDHWYVVFTMDVPSDYGVHGKAESKGPSLGIDVGISKLITYAKSDGSSGSFTFHYNEPNPNRTPKMREIQLQISRNNEIIDQKVAVNLKRYGMHKRQRIDDPIIFNNVYHTRAIQKLRRRNAKLYKMAVDYKHDCILKACHMIVRSNPAFVCIENLDVTHLIELGANRGLRQKCADAELGFLRYRLEQKCEQYEIILVEAAVDFPSSQICSECGERAKEKVLLTDRVFKCEYCGSIIDRDINAAFNLLKYGRRYLTQVASKIAPNELKSLDTYIKEF